MRKVAIGLTVFLGIVSARSAGAVTVTFDSLPAGTKVSNQVTGLQVTAVNAGNPGHPDLAIIFDSACPPNNLPENCTGDDPDLKTPGVGTGNDTAQNKVLIIAENKVDNSPTNGLVDQPDDEWAGGSLRIAFSLPTKLFSLRIVDIDVNEPLTFIELELTGGGTQTVPVPVLGNNSAQTVLIPDPIPTINAFRLVLAGSGAVDDIVYQQCGNDVLESGEVCDGTDASACPGQCTETCTCPGSTTTSSTTVTTAPGSTTTLVTTTTLATTTTVEETTTTLATTTTVEGPTTTLATTTTLVTTTTEATTTTSVPTTTTLPPPPRCGDNVVNQETEQCDGTDAGQCPGKPCKSDCLCPVCGNGIIEPGEVCEPPSVGICDANCRLAACPTQTEICNNTPIDDDGDGFVDCADPDCTLLVPPPCGCAPIRKDPARIRFDATKTGADFFSIHGHFEAFGSVDLDNVRFGVLLMNDLGRVYQGSLAAGELHRLKGGKGRYVFRDRRALNGGAGDADGIYRVGTRMLRHSDGVTYLHFRVKVYGDFSAATLARMTTQIVAGDEVGALTADWKQLKSGWVLRASDYETVGD